MKTPPKTEAPKKAGSKAGTKTATKARTRTVAKAKPASKRASPAKAARKAKPAAPSVLGPKSKAVSKTAPKSRGGKAAAPAKPRDPSAELTALTVAALEDLKAVDIKVLDVRDLTPIADAMVICTGTSNRHVKSLAENVVDCAKQRGFRPLGLEGLSEGEWVLVDLNGVLVHVMQAQTRLFYQLEKLWDMSQAA
jgi:ribosome-associated protein